MVEKKTMLVLAINILSVVILVSIFLQISLFGTGFSLIDKKGISGLSIGKTSLGEEIKSKYPAFSSLSPILLIIETLVFISLIASKTINNKKTKKNEAEITWLYQKYENQKDKTPLDVLYYILRDKKHLSLQIVEKVFGIPKDIAKSWCYTLESGNLATLKYPGIGDPELVLNS